MAKHRQENNQFTFNFEQAELPRSPDAAPTAHAQMSPATPPPESAAALTAESEDIEAPRPTLPVPRPLATAVEQGVFGLEENEDPVEPTPEEVHAISLRHGERLVELFEALRDLQQRLAVKRGGRAELIAEKERLTCQVQGTLGLYAEDFGDEAARHLETWARHQVGPACLVTEKPLHQPGGRCDNDPPPAGEQRPTPTATEAEAPQKRSRPSTSKSEKLERLHENVERALDGLAASLDAGQSDTLKAWLTTMSRFHDYSLNNQMLIAFQCPDATRVAGFHAWKTFNRLVNKGEKGIMILAPVTRPVAKVEERDGQGKTKETTVRRIVNTKVVYVFDISQTHGEPLPEFKSVEGDAAAHLLALRELVATKGIELYFEDRLPGGAQGRSEGGRIGCKNGLSPAEEFHTLTHELAHELLHRGERRQQTTRRSRELEAESVAFVVCTAIGLDARQSSTDYIQLYRGNKQMLLESLQFIRQVSKDILSALLPSQHNTPLSDVDLERSN